MGLGSVGILNIIGDSSMTVMIFTVLLQQRTRTEDF